MDRKSSNEKLIVYDNGANHHFFNKRKWFVNFGKTSGILKYANQAISFTLRIGEGILSQFKRKTLTLKIVNYVTDLEA